MPIALNNLLLKPVVVIVNFYKYTYYSTRIDMKILLSKKYETIASILA